MAKRRIVLASSSPRRRQLMNEVGMEFEVITSQAEEFVEAEENASHLVVRLAELKARDVAGRVSECTVIGADTVVVLDDLILGKPVDETDAVRMLGMLSGRTHTVYTGVCVINADTGYETSSFATTQVTFRSLRDDQIFIYVKTGEPIDKAGSYAIQGRGTLLIDRIEGEYTNVVGLPMGLLSDLLCKHGIELL